MDCDHRLLLIDGHAVAYRAFFAIRELSTAAGEPTNAVYGFIRMVQHLVRHWNPSHAAVVFDGGLSAERMELLPSYKAQRAAMPDALRMQFSAMEEFLAQAGLAMVRQEQQEADDVLATLCDQASAASAEVLVATGDKDMFQLANEQVFIIPTTKSDERMGPPEVLSRTGVLPRQIPDWLALIGDQADNIPGVPGVGPKTAAKLLREFQSVDGLYAALAAVPSDKLRAALESHRASVERNLKMTRLHTDLPLAINWRDCRLAPGDTSGLLSLYRRLEFHAMVRSLENPPLFTS